MGIICQSSGIRERVLSLTLHWQGEMPQHWAAPQSGVSRRDQTCNMLEERKQKRGKKKIHYADSRLWQQSIWDMNTTDEQSLI